MKSLVAAVGFLALITIASSFDTLRFLSRNCQSRGNELVCDIFDFNQRDQDDIQNTKFIISNASSVSFRMCTIGVFNENLVNKFPNASVFELVGCTLSLKSVASPISEQSWKLTTLRFVDSRVFDSNSSKAFHKFPVLKEFEWRGQDRLQYTIDADLLSRNYQLTSVLFAGNDIVSIHPLAFSTLQNLRKLNISNTLVQTFSTDTLFSNYKLEELICENNLLEDIPLQLFPKSIVSINLSRNFLQVVTSKHFEGLRYLEHLDLSENQISVLSYNAFNSTRRLTTLDLHSNEIKRFHRKQFSECLNLEKVYIYGNLNQDLPEDIFDDLSNLQVAKVKK